MIQLKTLVYQKLRDPTQNLRRPTSGLLELSRLSLELGAVLLFMIFFNVVHFSMVGFVEKFVQLCITE